MFNFLRLLEYLCSLNSLHNGCLLVFDVSTINTDLSAFQTSLFSMYDFLLSGKQTNKIVTIL